MKKSLMVAFLLLSTGWLMAQTVVRQISEAEFRQLIWDYTKYPAEVKLTSKLPVLVDFYATWCGPCKQLSPSIDRLQREFVGKVVVYRVDVDKDRALAEKMNIQAMPTLMYFNKKNQKSTTVGYISYEELKNSAVQKLLLKR